MTKYSHTRLSTFENCPLQYRFKYIDEIETPFEQTDSTFLGSMCHKTLEKLYKDRIDGITDSEDEILRYFDDCWKDEYDPEKILHIEKDKSGEYFRMLGRGWIERYYEDFYLEDRMTILGVETDDVLELPDGNEYYIRIDKLGYMDGTYYVCDYKTDRRVKEQSVADADRQLAMYALWVKRTFPDAKKVKLLWQMLRFTGKDAQTVSERSVEQLDELERDVTSLIKRIEGTEVFEPTSNNRCDYCVYHDICPVFAPPKILTIDNAVELADELIRNKEQIKDLELKNEQIEADLSKIASENQCDIISGTEKDLSVRRIRSVEYTDRNAVECILKANGRYDDYKVFDIRSLNKDIIEGNADPDIYCFVDVKECYSFRSRNKQE